MLFLGQNVKRFVDIIGIEPTERGLPYLRL